MQAVGSFSTVDSGSCAAATKINRFRCTKCFLKAAQKTYCSVSDEPLGAVPLDNDAAIEAEKSSLLDTLKECSRSKDLTRGKEAHSRAINSRLISNIFIANSLINMYTKCGNMEEARKVFDDMLQGNKESVASWNILLWGYANHGSNELALELFDSMEEAHGGYAPNTRVYVAALTACSNLADRRDDKFWRWFEKAKAIHSQAVMNNCCGIFVENMLVDLYASACGSMQHARAVFDNMKQPDEVSWGTLMKGYAENGDNELVLDLLKSMEETCPPNDRVFLVVVGACASLAARNLKEVGHVGRWLEKGKAIHSRVMMIGCCSKSLGNALVTMYASCGSMNYAGRVFEGLEHTSVVAWNAFLQGYVKNGESELALNLFERMDEYCLPNDRTFVAVASACTALAAEGDQHRWLEKGKSLHSQAVLMGCGSSTFVGSALIDMYAKCGFMNHAQSVFRDTIRQCSVCCNTLMWGYVENEESEVALEYFDSMEDTSIRPSVTAYLAAVTACTSLAATRYGYTSSSSDCSKWLEKGKSIHSRAVMDGCWNVYVGNGLITLYAGCKRLQHAQLVFDENIKKFDSTWNALLQGYVENKESKLALQTFHRMEETCSPTCRSFIPAVVACTMELKRDGNRRKWLETGKVIHSQAIRSGYCNAFVQSSLMDLYANCGSTLHARSVFDHLVDHRDAVSWTCMIQAYGENGEGELALETFYKGVEDGRTACARTYSSAILACGSLATRSQKWLERGKAVHSMVVRDRYCDGLVEGSLVSMYGKCGKMVHARSVFNSMEELNLVAWNGLIEGYVQNGENEVALKVVAEMDLTGVGQDAATFQAAVTACGNLMMLKMGEELHSEAVSCGLEKDEGVASSLVEFYSKCGCMVAARRAFDAGSDGGKNKHLQLWNSLIYGYSLQGDSLRAIETFEEMKLQKIQPSEVTFAYILSACSHTGMVDQGRAYFDAMRSVYGISPRLEHYSCVIDLLGRANHFDEALKVLSSMPFEPCVVIWKTLLGACHKWNNVVVGKFAYESLLTLNEQDTAAYPLMANIYGAAES